MLGKFAKKQYIIKSYAMSNLPSKPKNVQLEGEIKKLGTVTNLREVVRPQKQNAELYICISACIIPRYDPGD